jgi:trimeric autotransporter adhesin
MRQQYVRLIVLSAWLFAITWGAGCGAAATSVGCSGPCGPAQAPTAPAAANNNAALKGNYAFTFTGIKGNGTVSSISAAVGMFTSDGAGNLTSGELDMNGVGTGATLTAQAFTGTYTIGADNRGVMTWNLPAGAVKFAIAMTANGNARFIEFDASAGSGTIGSGTIEGADTSAYTAASITGDYAFGVAGLDNVNNRAAIIGRFTSNGTGTLAGAAGDLNAYGTPYSLTFSSANYTVSDTKSGRGTMNLAFTFGGAPASLNFVFYIVNAGRLFAMERDTVTTATPLLNGTVVRQQTPAGGFTNASLSGNMVIYLTGLSNCGSGAVGVPKAVAGLFTAGSNGTLSLDFDENYCRAPRTVTGFSGTYSVASNGRTTIALAGYALVAYLANVDQAFLFVSDNNVLFGFGEPQAAGAFTNGAVKGTYAGWATNPASFGVTVFTGEFTADSVSPTGNITGHEDIGAPSGPASGAAFNATYSVSPSPTNGRGTMTVNSGTGGNAVIYTISPSKFVALSQNDPNPAILVFEQTSTTASPAPTATLSSLTLNPTSVVGGSESSTGTVTLSGPAPAGGAQVTLASDYGAASVPSSVTVSTGATGASFTVNTTPVTASTPVTISGSYGGASKSATLTVTPAPLPTVSSLTLNPSSVVGGVQSSTGTVTLSSPAPAGGAQVALASNSGAASVPSAVTVPAGATSATFTVSTSTVVVGTSATISASYNNTMQTATLSVLI